MRLIVTGIAMDPCGDADGVYVSRTPTLADTSIVQPTADEGTTLMIVAVCNADLT